MLPRRLTESLSYAWYGIRFAVRTERNMRVHLWLAALAVGLGACFRIARWEWLGIALTVAMVLMAELLNTALEVLVDLSSPERRAKAKVIKDVAAGAVLVSSASAAIVGALIFLPRLANGLRP
jgi:diacylglycerol kinase